MPERTRVRGTKWLLSFKLSWEGIPFSLALKGGFGVFTLGSNLGLGLCIGSKFGLEDKFVRERLLRVKVI